MAEFIVDVVYFSVSSLWSDVKILGFALLATVVLRPSKQMHQ